MRNQGSAEGCGRALHLTPRGLGVGAKAEEAGLEAQTPQAPLEQAQPGTTAQA